jgi:membrane fusion protein, multidrug efflux system
VMVDRGKEVKQGDPMLSLDVRSAALGAREAQANLANARAQRALAEEECKRTKALFEKGAITRSEYDRQMTQCTSALQQVSAAEARTQMMTKSVADGIVRAPFAGVIAQKSVAPGEWVAPGRPLFTLVDSDPLRIELSVPEAAVRAIRKDQKVSLVSVAFPDRIYDATVTRIGAEVGRTRSLIVEATLDKPARRGPDGELDIVAGMFAEAHLTVGQQELPVVPGTAVVQRGKTWHAYVVVKGEIEDRVVQIGPVPSPGLVAIQQGLSAGDKVVEKACTDKRPIDPNAPPKPKDAPAEKPCVCGYTFPITPSEDACATLPELRDGLRVE